MPEKKSVPKEFTFMRYKCEVCGKRSDKEKDCCGYPMADLMGDTCMACKGCGMH